MTEWQQECVNELERQMSLFPAVVLDEAQFRCLCELSDGVFGWDYEPIWNAVFSRKTYRLRLRLGHAEALRDRIKNLQVAKVTQALTGTQL